MQFEHYRILKNDNGELVSIGRGAMGITYEAFDTNLKTRVALKVISPQHLDSETARQRFMREARAAARLRHPNVATVYHLGETGDGSYYYAMEFCDGRNLQEVIAQDGPMEIREVLEIGRQVAAALYAAEREKVVHRDIKPSNIMYASDDPDELLVKVIDFGLARSFDENSDISGLSQSGMVGTPLYASPEQIEEQELDIRSDIYSLGVCLWFLLAGRPPFKGSAHRVMQQHLTSPLAWDQIPNLPQSVKNLLEKAMQKDPDSRFQSARAMRSEIQKCIDGLSHLRDPKKNPSRFHEGPVDDDKVIARRYHLLQELGSSDTGTTHRASDLQSGGQIVTVKLVKPTIIDKRSTVDELRQRAIKLKKHPHPHLVRLRHLILDPGFGAIVTEHITGLSLEKLLSVRESFTFEDAYPLLRQLAGAIDYARLHQLNGLKLNLAQILIAFPPDLLGRRKVEDVVRDPVNRWPNMRIKVSPWGFPDEDESLDLEGAFRTICHRIVPDLANKEAPEKIDAGCIPYLEALCEAENLDPREAAGMATLTKARRVTQVNVEPEEDLEDAELTIAPELTSVPETPESTYAPNSSTNSRRFEEIDQNPAKAVQQEAPPSETPAHESAHPTTPKKKVMWPLWLGLLAVLGIGGYFASTLLGGKSYESLTKKASTLAAEGDRESALDRLLVAYDSYPERKTEALAAINRMCEQWSFSSTHPTEAARSSLEKAKALGIESAAPLLASIKESSPQIAKAVPVDPNESKSEEPHVEKAEVVTQEDNALITRGLQMEQEERWSDAAAIYMNLVRENRAERDPALEGLKRIAQAVNDPQILVISTEKQRLKPAMKLAADQGVVDAMVTMADLSPFDSPEAFKYLEEAAFSGNPAAMRKVGLRKSNGHGTPRDLETAYDWFQKASNGGDTVAKTLLAECLFLGKGTRQNRAEALRIYAEAADLGEHRAMDVLGTYYQKGIATIDGQPDYQKARELFERAIAAGNPHAYTNLAVLYYNGQGVSRDMEKANYYLKQGAAKGSSGSMYYLGMLYQNGDLGQVDDRAARRWFREAARLGHPLAIRWCQDNGIAIPQ